MPGGFLIKTPASLGDSMKEDEEAWASKPADVKFLLDSGLLFEINRQVLHPLGLALTAKLDGSLQIKDSRAKPELLLFSQELLRSCRLKFKQFMAAYGNKQMDRRAKLLGQSCQWVPPEIGAAK